ncbi:MAG: flagellin [Phycisphaerae bacterium]|jgi:flagellar hook-associated protein 3 FlgL
MAVIPINLARVSQNLRAFNLLESVRANTTSLFRVQNQLSTGLRIARPSDDPLGATAVGAVDRQLDQIDQIQQNLLHANNALTLSEGAMLDAVNLLMDVSSVASETVGDTVGADEREALAIVVDSVLDQLIAVGNRRYMDMYLFSGHYTDDVPFELTEDGVLYRGDEGRSYTIVDTDMSQDSFTISGAEFFAATRATVAGVVDLDAALTVDTRISDLRGTTGGGVTLGRILVSDGNEEAYIDLSGADTVGDVLDKLNADMPGNLVAALDDRGITIGDALGAQPVTVRDLDGGQTARDLGLAAEGLMLAGAGSDLDPKVTLRTRVTDLAGGLGINVADSLTIRNGSQSATLDFSNAETVEDVLNLMNQADVGVWARLASDGRTIEVLNRISGSDLTIEENGGQLATALGLRTLHGGTTLSELNDGRGVETIDGADLRFVTADGSEIEVDVSGATTLAEVVDLINAQGGGAVTASLAATGNGLVITDQTAGAGTFRVERVNLSPALDGLGLDVTATGDTLAGRDVNPLRVDSGFTSLLELRDALQHDDTRNIGFAAERLENALKRMREVQGRMASHAKTMDMRMTRMEDEVTAARVLLSDVRDVDLADAVVRFQQVQTALQANLSTSTQIMNLSLIDYL